MNNTQTLTKKQKNVLKYIYDSIKSRHLPPTLREIAREFKFSSVSTVQDHLKALVQKGFIRIAPNKSRGIELIREAIFAVPILGKVQAGLPHLAVEEIEGYLNLESLVFSDNTTFALRVRGDSMVGAGIMPDDLVLVRRQSMAQVGEMVVALIEDEATVKKLGRDGSTYYLQPANAHYDPIKVDGSVSIIGKVISVIRKLQ